MKRRIIARCICVTSRSQKRLCRGLEKTGGAGQEIGEVVDGDVPHRREKIEGAPCLATAIKS